MGGCCLCWEYVKLEVLLSYFHSCFLVPVGSSPLPRMFYILSQKWFWNCLPSQCAFVVVTGPGGRGSDETIIRNNSGDEVGAFNAMKARHAKCSSGKGTSRLRCWRGQMSCAALAVLIAGWAIWAPRATSGLAKPGLAQSPPRNRWNKVPESSSWLGKDEEGPSRTFFAFWEFVEFCRANFFASEAQSRFPTASSSPCTLLALSGLISTELLKSDLMCFLHCLLSFLFLSLIVRVCSFLAFSGS